MKTQHLYFENEPHLQAFGNALSRYLPTEGLIFLQGDLGAGKTCLVRAILRGLGYQGHVKSPTFTLVEPYSLTGRILYHFDLYRLNSPEELVYIGIRDYLEKALCLVEWPEKGDGQLGTPDLLITLSIQNEGRRMVLSASTKQGDEVLENIMQSWKDSLSE